MIPPYNQKAHVSSKCIRCLENLSLTEEHIFADGAGGHLTAYILCATCNAHYGKHIDAPYLQQPIVQLARNAYRIGGRRNAIPQPLEGPYTITGPDGETKIKLDIDFKPFVITRADEIEIIDNDSIQFAVLVDASERSKIPQIIESKLERFFRSERGQGLNWSNEEQDRVIRSAIDTHMSAPDTETPTGMLSGRLAADLGTLFLEAAKVAFEIASIEGGDAFVDSPTVDHFRKLLDSVQGGRIEAIPSFEEMLRAFHAVPLAHNSEAYRGVQFLVDGKIHQHHVAILSGQHVVVSMFGDAYLFVNMRPIGPYAVYTNDTVTGTVGYMRM